VIHAKNILGLSVAVLILSGCSGPVGTWKMETISPRSAAAQFGLHKITFEANGQFEAEVLEGGRVVPISGTYIYDKQAELLTLNLVGGGTRQHAFETCAGCGYIYFMDAAGTGAYRAKMVRR
jgi:hypothetical protein